MRVLLIALMLLVAGCGGSAKFDGSSEDAAKASFDRMSAGMNGKDLSAFRADCMTAAVGGNLIAAGMAAKTGQSIFAPLTGMTIEQIRARAKEVRDEQAKSEP